MDEPVAKLPAVEDSVFISGEQVDATLDVLILQRRRQRLREEGQGELWAESARRHAEKQRQQARLEWHAHHREQADRLRSTLEQLVDYHERRAEELGGTA